MNLDYLEPKGYVLGTVTFSHAKLKDVGIRNSSAGSDARSLARSLYPAPTTRDLAVLILSV